MLQMVVSQQLVQLPDAGHVSGSGAQPPDDVPPVHWNGTLKGQCAGLEQMVLSHGAAHDVGAQLCTLQHMLQWPAGGGESEHC